jgi:hypothetical protein
MPRAIQKQGCSDCDGTRRLRGADENADLQECTEFKVIVNTGIVPEGCTHSVQRRRDR